MRARRARNSRKCVAREPHRHGPSREALRIEPLTDNPEPSETRSANRVSEVDRISLERLEFDRVLAAVAASATCEAAARALVAARPISDRERRAAEVQRPP